MHPEDQEWLEGQIANDPELSNDHARQMAMLCSMHGGTDAGGGGAASVLSARIRTWHRRSCSIPV
jgi:hypothetical protein